MTGSVLQPPTLIIANARIATGDPARPWVTALAIRGETLAATGSAAEILKLAAPATRVVDAGGRAITLPRDLKIGSPISVAFDADGGFALLFSEEKER
ncbi:MAG: hypothetical protein ACR2MQ_00875 [Gemmatimonadaceae bacterium]